MTRAEQARQAALERVGDAYVYGAWDQYCTVQQREKYANLSPTYASAIRNQCQRQSGSQSTCDGCRYNGKRIHDCRGLTDTCAKAANIKIDGQTVAAQWSGDNWDRKGTIDTLPKQMPYVQLFRHNGSKWTHTGIYIGDDNVIDARGHANGVIQSKLGSYKWTHWATPRGMYDDNQSDREGGKRVIYAALVTTNGGRLNIRCGPGLNCRVIGSLLNGEKVDVHTEYDTNDDNVPDWAYIAGDGLTGYVSMQYLTPIDRPGSIQEAPHAGQEETDQSTQQSSDPSWGVWIPCDNEAEARRYAGDIKKSIILKRM